LKPIFQLCPSPTVNGHKIYQRQKFSSSVLLCIFRLSHQYDRCFARVPCDSTTLL